MDTLGYIFALPLLFAGWLLANLSLGFIVAACWLAGMDPGEYINRDTDED